MKNGFIKAQAQFRMIRERKRYNRVARAKLNNFLT